jgi:K+-sensing histidine kinase KdpD
MPRSVPSRDVVVGVGSLVVIGAVTALLRLLPGVSPTTAALVLLLVVLGVATMARLRIAIFVSFLATLTLNFFFLPPIGAFTIADPQHSIALLVFVLVAIVASNLSASALLRQKAELAETLLTSLSHDVRTPLTVVRTAVENLRDDLPMVDRRVQAGAAIVELDRLIRLFQDLLEMARIDAAAIRTERQWVAAADVVDAAAAHVRHALQAHALRVDVDRDSAVEIDPRLVSVALSQLLENAALYSPAQSEILVRARVEPDGLHIAVTDQGPGLDPQELDRIFERFYRGRASRQSVTGTGMGLSIARGLMAAVGGQVWAENVPGAGARFTLVVPGATRVVTVAH